MNNTEYNKLIYDTQYSDKNLTFSSKKEQPYQYELQKIKIRLLKEYCKNKRVLDMGCGTGNYAFIASKTAIEVVGVDFSQNMLNYFRKRIEEKKSTNIKILQGDIANLPKQIKTNYFDVVFSYSVLYHMQNIGKALGEMCRVLKPGGYAIFDLGNSWSINTLLCRNSPTRVKSYHLLPVTMKKWITENNLQIEELRYFQLFPMYGGKIFGFKGEERLIRFLTMSGRFEKRIFSYKVRGKMLDEIISSSPFFRNFAFRYLFVCQK